MDVLITPSGINPLDANFPTEGGGCAYDPCPTKCSCNIAGCYQLKGDPCFIHW